MLLAMAVLGGCGVCEDGGGGVVGAAASGRPPRAPCVSDYMKQCT